MTKLGIWFINRFLRILKNEIFRVPFGTHSDNQKKTNVNIRQYIIQSFLMSEL